MVRNGKRSAFLWIILTQEQITLFTDTNKTSNCHSCAWTHRRRLFEQSTVTTHDYVEMAAPGLLTPDLENDRAYLNSGMHFVQL